MKANFRTRLIFVWLLMASTAFAQGFTIDWFGADESTTTSTGSVYAISTSFGQPLAGPVSGGVYSVEAGFWAVDGSQAILPISTLSITFAGTLATITWTPQSPGYVLEATGNLTDPQWSDVPGGGSSPVKVTVTSAMKYYRLRN